MFVALDHIAVELQRSATELQRTRTRQRARKLSVQLRRDFVQVVRHEQAIVDGYAALSCDPGTAVCCQTRTVAEQGGRKIEGCHWACVQQVNRCSSGVVGPTIPLAAPTAAPLQR